MKDAGILGLQSRGIQSGARLDCSELLCNKVLSKYKRDRESFRHRHQKGAERVPPASLSVQFSSVAQLCPTLWDPVNLSTPGLPVHHQLPEFTQTHVHRVGDAIQSSHPLSSLLLLPPIPPSIRVFSNTTVQKHPSFSAHPSL